MEITKVTKKGNIYVTLSNGKWAGIIDLSGKKKVPRY